MELTHIGPLEVSNLALGAMHFGTRTPGETALSLLNAYTEHGGNFIDTANNYAFWIEGGTGRDSESLIGEWIATRGRRDDVVIATKVGAGLCRPGGGIEDWQGLGKSQILDDIDQSLRHLRTDYVDLYYAHIDDRLTPIEETLEALDQVVKAGKARAIACSNFNTWRIERARQVSRRLGIAEFIAVQSRHTYFQPAWRADFGFRKSVGERGGWGLEEGTTDEHLDYVRSNPGFRLVAYTPLLRGGYSTPSKLGVQYQTSDNAKRRQVLDAIVAETGASANQIVLAWLLRSQPASIPLIAPSSLAQLEDSLGGSKLALGAEQINRMDCAPTSG